MGLAVASAVLLKAAVVWIVLQWGIEALVSKVPSLRPVAGFLKKVNVFAVDVVVTLCALLVLLPSVVFIVLEVFGYIRQRTRTIQAKTIPQYVAHAVGVLQGLEVMGERLRHVALGLTADIEETMCETSEVIHTPEPALMPRACGEVLMAVCKHSESMERLFGALQPAEVDEMIFCDCEGFEFRGEKIVALMGILRECMERQTEVVRAVDALCPTLPPVPAEVCEPDGDDDSGFIEC